jgi:FixJ family two-component response regulator
LLDAIRQAIERDRIAHTEWQELAELRRRFDSLTPRERDVMAGVLNKQIAAQLGSAEATVKEQRER